MPPGVNPRVCEFSRRFRLARGPERDAAAAFRQLKRPEILSEVASTYRNHAYFERLQHIVDGSGDGVASPSICSRETEGYGVAGLGDPDRAGVSGQGGRAFCALDEHLPGKPATTSCVVHIPRPIGGHNAARDGSARAADFINRPPRPDHGAVSAQRSETRIHRIKGDAAGQLYQGSIGEAGPPSSRSDHRRDLPDAVSGQYSTVRPGGLQHGRRGGS
jgi:hypothetical protein